jgi:hypothetical protein
MIFIINLRLAFGSNGWPDTRLPRLLFNDTINLGGLKSAACCG